MFKSMYKILYVISILLLLVVTSCKDFGELNTNPTKASSADPNSQLTYIQLLMWGSWVTTQPYVWYCSSFTQQLQGEWNVTNYGGQYRRSDNVMRQTWEEVYSESVKNMIDVLSTTEGKPIYQNVRSVARLFKVYYFMILTDLYGDIPYSEAGKGYTEGIVSPVYDSQESIYKDFLKELKEVELALNEDGGSITSDVVYNGDIKKWKRFANSLRLRVAMRLTKMDPELAKEEVIDILNTESGVLTASDNAFIKYLDVYDWSSDEIRSNSISLNWRGRDPYPTEYICSTFWNYLKDTNDPRLFRYGRAYDETKSAANNPFSRIDITDEILSKKGINQFQPPKPGYFWYQKWPSGYMSTLTNKWQDKSCRPQVNNAFLKGDTPGVLITYPEVQLLLCEAKVRWGASISGNLTAAQYYKNGVTSAMKVLAEYGIDEISNEGITNYLNANPFPSTEEKQLKAINEQLWILHFNNPPEAYSNWRRSSYPVLKPSSEYGAITIESQTIPRRLNYPLSEASYNGKSYNEAIANLGGSDDWNARVWWDKE